MKRFETTNWLVQLKGRFCVEIPAEERICQLVALSIVAENTLHLSSCSLDI